MNSTLKLAVVAAALADDVREAPRLARVAGIEGLLFDAFGTSFNFGQLSQSGRREFRHVLAAQDRVLAGLRVDAGPQGVMPGSDPDRVLARLDTAMEAAKGLGAPLVCVELGPLPLPPRTIQPKPKVSPELAGMIIIPTPAKPAAPEHAPAPDARDIDPAAIAQVDAVLADLGRRADRYGVVVALRSELSSLEALERALSAASCPWFGVDLDPTATLRDEWDADETFSRLGSLVRHVRVRDALRGAQHRTRPTAIGRGSVVWDALLANLDAADYHGWLTLDVLDLPDRAAAARDGAAFLRTLRPQ